MICAGKKGKDSCQVKILNTEVDTKGQLILNGHFGFFNSPKKRTKFNVNILQGLFNFHVQEAEMLC